MPGPSAQGWPAVIAQSWVCSIWDTHRSDNMIQGGERQYSPRAGNLLHIGEESDNVLVGVVFPGCRSTCPGHKPSKRLTFSLSSSTQFSICTVENNYSMLSKWSLGICSMCACNGDYACADPCPCIHDPCSNGASANSLSQARPDVPQLHN